MVEAFLEGIGTYVTKRQSTAAQYIATRPIMDLCERSARRPGRRCIGGGGNSTFYIWRGQRIGQKWNQTEEKISKED